MSSGLVLARRARHLARAAGRQHTGSRGWSFLPNADERRLKRLAEDANIRMHDPDIQAAYLRALGKVRPEDVIRRVEGGSFATGESVAKEYLKALVATGSLDRVKLPEMLRAMSAQPAPVVVQQTQQHLQGSGYPTNAFRAGPMVGAATSMGGGGGGAGGGFGAGSAAGGAAAAGGFTAAATAAAKGGSVAEPIHVTLAEPSMQQQLWRAVRVLGTTFLVLGFIGVIMEERGMSRGVGINTDMAPQPEPSEPKSFEDVKGCDEAKAELEEIVQYLRSPSSFTRLGGKLPKGVLLVGPPGTGKTLLARAIAGEAQRPFFYASGSEFEEMFVGVGAKRVRELFAAAKAHAPCIIFIDEIDAIGGKRNPKDQRFLSMTLNQFLVELDGFQSSEGIIVIAATNFPESLDAALTRPGRFDRHVVVPNPDMRGRTQILAVHTKDMPLESDVDLEIIARGTPGFSGADLANLANMAALKAAIDGVQAVAMSHLEFAKDKILMGAERKSALISEETRTLTSYHESGHSLLALYTTGSLPIHKATIVPRGQALGMVSQLPDKDMTSMSRQQMLAKLDVCMGGRAAEELIFGRDHITSGASSDFELATKLAEAMVTRYGMSDMLGQVVYEKQTESTETRALIESEVKALLDGAYQRAIDLLTARKSELHNLAAALLQRETLNGEEVKLAAKGQLPALVVSGQGASGKAQSKPVGVDSNPGVLDAPAAARDAEM